MDWLGFIDDERRYCEGSIGMKKKEFEERALFFSIEGIVLSDNVGMCDWSAVLLWDGVF